MRHDTGALVAFLNTGGPAMWAIAVLSVLTLAIVLWKLWRLLRVGAWGADAAEQAVRLACTGRRPDLPAAPRNLRLRFVAGTLGVLALPPATAREETARLAQRELAELRRGLRPLELIVTIAPLIGLLGTVLGMIEAFRTLQDSGGQADPAMLAGGIWQALLTTAAGMAVAIPAAVALSWFDGIAETVQADLEDIATRLFIRAAPAPGRG